MTLGERLRNFTLGGELYLGKALQVRIGYDNAIRVSQSSATASFLTGMGVGVGIVFPEFTLDYTLTIMSTPAIVHRVSCGLALERLFTNP